MGTVRLDTGPGLPCASEVPSSVPGKQTGLERGAERLQARERERGESTHEGRNLKFAAQAQRAGAKRGAAVNPHPG